MYEQKLSPESQQASPSKMAKVTLFMKTHTQILRVGALLCILILASAIVALSGHSKIQQQSKVMMDKATEADSDFVGQSGSCEPLDSRQWYRTNKTLTLDPVNPNALNVFVEKRGFFRTTDGGQTWQYKSKGIKGFASDNAYKDRPCYLEFKSAIIDPTNPNRMLLGAAGDFDTIDTMINKAGGMLETLDGGETWHQYLNNKVNADIHDMVINPLDPNMVYYVTTTQKPLQRETLMTKGIGYVTTDGGKNWEELSTGFLPNTGGQQIFIDHKNPQRLMITTISFVYNQPGVRAPAQQTLGVLVTEDGGKTWQSRRTLPPGDDAVASSYHSPTRFENMYVSVLSDSGAKSFYTTDAGKSFSRSLMPMDVVAYDPTDVSGRTLIGYSWQSSPSKSLFKSTDGGKIWQVAGTLPSEIVNIQDFKTIISKIIIDPHDNKTIYMSGANAYVWKSTDGGKTWQAILSLNTLP